MIKLNINTPTPLDPTLSHSVSYVEFTCNLGETFTLKYIEIAKKEHFLQVMNYSLNLLNKRFSQSDIDTICKDAVGSVQYVYSVLGEYLETEADVHLSSELEIDRFFANAHNINDVTSPINAAMMLFCDEKGICNKLFKMAC